MREVNVLIVVDVEGALASNDLGSNVYMIDTNKHFGSGSEGQEELVTACKDGQILVWSVAAVNSGNNAEIAGFKGTIIDQKICQPKQSTPVTGMTVWAGRVESQGTSNTYQYSCTLSFDGKAMDFDPYLKVSAS